MKFRSFGDSTSSRVQDKLKTISLSCRQINPSGVGKFKSRVDPWMKGVERDVVLLAYLFR